MKGSIIDSTDYRTIVQRRLGLYLTCLAVALDESEARGAVVTQHERLGDAASSNGSGAELFERF